jgi:hypothetical protein
LLRGVTALCFSVTPSSAPEIADNTIHARSADEAVFMYSVGGSARRVPGKCALSRNARRKCRHLKSATLDNSTSVIVDVRFERRQS